LLELFCIFLVRRLYGSVAPYGVRAVFVRCFTVPYGTLYDAVRCRTIPYFAVRCACVSIRYLVLSPVRLPVLVSNGSRM
jgi:hypothetical protein